MIGPVAGFMDKTLLDRESLKLGAVFFLCVLPTRDCAQSKTPGRHIQLAFLTLIFAKAHATNTLVMLVISIKFIQLYLLM